jgi:hypothetical protein
VSHQATFRIKDRGHSRVAAVTFLAGHQGSFRR